MVTFYRIRLVFQLSYLSNFVKLKLNIYCIFSFVRVFYLRCLWFHSFRRNCISSRQENKWTSLPDILQDAQVHLFLNETCEAAYTDVDESGKGLFLHTLFFSPLRIFYFNFRIFIGQNKFWVIVGLAVVAISRTDRFFLTKQMIKMT